MKKANCFSCFLVVLGLFGVVIFSDVSANENTYTEALSGGEVSGGFRLRSEHVKDDNPALKDAHAVTLRTRLAYTSMDYHGLSGTLEFDNVSALAGQDNYAPERSGYAVIADSRSTEMNQALITYNSPFNLKSILGRQRIVLDNQRFVGAVGWRQDDQTFDAVRFQYKTSKLEAIYAYVDRVHGITPAFDADVSSHLTNVSYTFLPRLKSTVYAYRLHDSDDFITAAKDTETYGARVSGSFDNNNVKLLYVGEAAHQKAKQFDVLYVFGELGIEVNNYGLTSGYERLGSDDGAYGFQTPLATKHAFNGWADKLLLTPAEGLEDFYLKGSVSMAGINTVLVFHDYQASEGSTDYGYESNIVMSYKIDKQQRVGVKYASYHADAVGTDAQKVWLWTELIF